MDWGESEYSQTSPKYEVMRWKNFQADGVVKSKPILDVFLWVGYS